MNAKIKLAAFFCLLFNVAMSQTWDLYQTVGGPGEDAFTCMETEGNSVWVAGAYNQPFTWGGFGLPEFGSGDVFLARLDETASPVWVLSGGGTDTDDATALAVRADGGAVFGGAFWDEITLDTWTGIAPAAGKALFILSVSGQGVPEWGKVISGPGSKGIREMGLDAAGNLYATGYFGGTLAFEDTTLQAHGDLDGFAAKWDAGGGFQWAIRFGESGSVRGECLATRLDAQLFLGGRYNGSMSMAGTEIQSNTFDDDGFVAALSADTGEPLWLRKAGAQYDDAVNAIAVNGANELFATGTFTGVLQVADGWNITTQGFNTNFFLIRYDCLDGTPEWAQSLGNLTDEQGLALKIRNDGPVVAGLFRNSLTLEGQTVSGIGDVINGFAAGFRSSGSLRWLKSFPGESFVLPEALSVADDGDVWVAGGFSGTAYFDGEPVTSDGFFDAWVGRLTSTATSTSSPGLSPVTVFPNPASDFLHLGNIHGKYNFRLVSPAGTVLLQGGCREQIDIHALPAGLYFLEVRMDEMGAIFAVPVQKIK